LKTDAYLIVLEKDIILNAINKA